MNTISFHDTQFTIVPHNDQIWLTATQIAQALGYAREDAVSRIYARNADEFTPCMTLTVNLTVKGFGNGSSEKEVRIFSLRGAHLIAMFSRTALAKEFRRWVLDVLDRETATNPQPITTLTYDELRDLAWCWRAADKMWHFAQSVENLLDAAEHREAPNCYSIVREYRNTLSNAKAVLVNHTRDLPPALYADDDSNWARVLRPLHDQPARQINHSLRLR